MFVLDGFVRMRLYRERASEFELLAETEDSPEVRLRYRIVASHYRALIEREEKADKAMMAELIERARLQRQQAASKASLPTSNSQSFPNSDRVSRSPSAPRPTPTTLPPIFAPAHLRNRYTQAAAHRGPAR